MIHHQWIPSVINPDYLLLEAHFSPTHFRQGSRIFKDGGECGLPWANGAMRACFHWRRSDALTQTNMKQCRGRCWATFWAICPLFGMVIDYPYILVWSGSMSKRTCVKSNLFRSWDGKHHIGPDSKSDGKKLMSSQVCFISCWYQVSNRNHIKS